ncbi:MAG: 3' terminal RNA ribose 2'-O-methyltransferase Hen1 [Actinomycetota bacterium]|nr:3' terminal RNA ribose 2'-O-methyltransferase Hen1 [Actinomycetota bacterium]
MLLTISTTTRPATDLGYLLHKHPDRVQSFRSSVGVAHVFYPEATEDRCMAALLLEVDAVGLARGRRPGNQAFSLAQYVNDRPYAASSFLSVAMSRVFRTAMTGRCDARPELAGAPLALEIRVPSLSSSGGEALIREMFEPLGWGVTVRNEPLDPNIPRWGGSRSFDVTLSATMPLDQALSQFAVLLPCLDGGKHYWVNDDEVDKLVRTGGAWLARHPRRDTIVRRSLAHQRDLVLSAVGRLAESDDTAPDELDNAVAVAADVAPGWTPEVPEQPKSLAQQRIEAVLAALGSVRAHRVVDMGCGEGALLRRLLQDPTYTEVVGADVSSRALDIATRRLGLDRMPDSQRARLRLLQSSLMYGDRRLTGFDAMVLQEVVEHVDPDRLPSLERNVFAVARPMAVVVTTPNREFNARYESLPAGTMRHRDHRFEWSRAELAGWATGVADRHSYRLEIHPVGEVDESLGPATQLALFIREEVRTP